METSVDVVVVGAGLAGLACGRDLVRAGKSVLVIEASDRVGGRVATDDVEGFRLDRGFQVYNDAYPEGRRCLDLAALRLGRFEPGALVASAGRLARVADPWRRPFTALGSVVSGRIGVGDAIRTARLRRDAVRAVRAGLLDPNQPADADRSTLEELRIRGFSPRCIGSFFRPFFGGVFLERDLDTSSDVFRFDFAMFALGRACLPFGGMDAIPRQIAAALPPGGLWLNARVERVATGRVWLEDGRTVSAQHVVVATEGAGVAAVLPESCRQAVPPRPWKGTRTVAFAAPRSPLAHPELIVTEDDGPIDNLTVPSDVVGGYAPAGTALVVVSIRQAWADDVDLVEAVRRQAAQWFGPVTLSWRHLRTTTVTRALPAETPAARRLRHPHPVLEAGLYVCGDHCTSASINGALASGRRCAEAVIAGEHGGMPVG